MQTRANVYVLLHGAWHASWCWKYVTPLLQQAGHSVIAHDFAGHGKNQQEFTKINLKTYVQELKNLILSQGEPVILVAHSFAGVIASQVAEEIPDQIKKIIYVAAFVPINNSSLILESNYSKYDFNQILKADVQKNSLICDLSKPEMIKNNFYNKCLDSDLEFALTHLQAEPLLPFGQTVKLTQDNFGRVEKQYIACLQDNAIDSDNQLRMANNANIKNISKLDSDHSPFFSMPNILVDRILF
jgi:alpha-beta hydrolase superfamily lysophospholipase